MLIARNYLIKKEHLNLLEDILIKYFTKDFHLELNNNENMNDKHLSYAIKYLK